MQVRAVLKMGKFSRDNSGQEISHRIPVSVRFPKNIHRHFTENSKTGHRFPRWSCYHRGRKKELPGDTFRAFASGMQSRSVRGIFLRFGIFHSPEQQIPSGIVSAAMETYILRISRQNLWKVLIGHVIGHHTTEIC